MKVTNTCIVLCVALACLACEGSAQQNWWERGPDGSPMIGSSRTTSRPTNGGSTSGTPAPAMMPTNCPCPVTPEYNPVCGDLGGNNRLTYTNPGLLTCAQNCGQNVRLLFHGRCEKVA
ncbi:uncharacterized protein LOC105689350 [Athalia rosae]|uniref:uncharacterized protein LOC105689350 n=1 Tax=Athalia rosae TaxID=37344 RepID=UPI0020335688|nr:uncharacterized protein LOC105689350 [Athalia rosae]